MEILEEIAYNRIEWDFDNNIETVVIAHLKDGLEFVVMSGYDLIN